MAGEEVMSNQKLSSTLVITWVAVPSLTLFLGAGPAMAQTSTTNYTFLVGCGVSLRFR